MRRVCAFTLVVGVLMGVSTAQAHQGNPNMESVVRGITPRTSGVTIQVLNRDDRFELDNRSGQPVVVYGYNDEPYARVLADGTVQLNKNSPAYYLNEDRYAAVAVPANAKRGAPAAWSTLDKTGRFQWHDHRMHYMGKGVPATVKDTSKRQKVFDYRIPIQIGPRKGAIAGTLWWTPQSNSFPVGMIVGLGAFLIVGFAFGTVMSRRRRSASSEQPATPDTEPKAEVW